MRLFNRRSKTKSVAALDVRDGAVVDLTDKTEAKALWGFPTSCPECDSRGYLDRIDVVNEVMFQHCPSCWARWETPRSDTVEA